jgi:DNA-binding MarR family transcriptional regulator
MTRKTKSHLGEELIAAVRENQAAVDKMDEAGAEALGVNRTDGRCLDVIQRWRQVSAGRLASETGLTTGAVTAALDRLEGKGYVRRAADPSDRRRVLVELTELAERRTWELWGPLGERGRPIVSRYSVRELELLIEFMRLGTALNDERAAEIRAELAAARGEAPEEAKASSLPRGPARPDAPSAAPPAPPAS